MNEIKRLQNLAGIKEQDEFTVDAPDEWNITYLEVGDTITPDMWSYSEYNGIYPDIVENGFLEEDEWDQHLPIKNIYSNYLHDDNEEDRVDLGVRRIALVDVNEHLKPEYKIVNPFGF